LRDETLSWHVDPSQFSGVKQKKAPVAMSMDSMRTSRFLVTPGSMKSVKNLAIGRFAGRHL